MAVYLVHNPYWDSLGGGERYTATFVRLLLDLGHQVHIDFAHDISDKIKERFGIDLGGVKWNSSPKADFTFWVSDGSLPTNLSGKTLVHFQIPFQNVNGKSFKNFAKSRLYNFVSNSQFTKHYVDHEFNIDSKVVYPPVDLNSFKPGKKQNIIFYLARFSGLTQKKNHDLLIKFFAEMSSQIKGWKLVLAGGTDIGVEQGYLEELKQLASRLPVKIMANPSFSDIKNLYASAKIYCSPSGFGTDNPKQMEHFGITVVEAMSAGCVPLIVNLGGHREIVEDGKNGFLWNTKNQFQELLFRLAIQDLDSLSQAAIQRSKIFSEEVFRESFTKLI